MTRIKGMDAARTECRFRSVLDAQAEKWGASLSKHLLYAKRPWMFRGAGAMWAGLDASGLLDAKVVTLLNRRVAALNGCVDRVRTGFVGATGRSYAP